MLESRSLRDLCCHTQATLLRACLSDDELRGLGAWDEGPNRLGFSPALWCRALVHRACHHEPATARRVSDLLDLQYLDAIVTVRCLEPDALRERVDSWVARPVPAELPGLLWALCTDPRDAVHALGARLCHEAVHVALRTLVEPPRALGA